MTKIRLKNPRAQNLLEKKQITIEGITINLWTGENKNNFDVYNNWNKIKSYTELNEKTSGISGDIVLTGVMQIPRKEIAEYACELGFRVHTNISNNTDYIVIGTENVSPSKVARCIELNEKGANIQFVDEITFLDIVLDNLNINNETIKYEAITHETKKHNTENKPLKTKIKENHPRPGNKLDGLTIVISGVFQKYSRDEIKSLIESHGGKNTSSISKKTDYLIAGEKIGPSKLAKAEKMSVKIISEDEFEALIS